MGRDKSFLPIRGVPAIQCVAESLREIFPEVFVVANGREPFRKLGFRVVSDLLAGNDSLGGLHAAVASAGASHVFVTGCDMPTLQPALLAGLASRAKEWDVVIPVYRGFPEPLCAVYGAVCEGPIKSRIQEGKLKMIGFHDEVRVMRVEEEEWRLWDPEGLSFRNLNTPEEYEAIQSGG